MTEKTLDKLDEVNEKLGEILKQLGVTPKERPDLLDDKLVSIQEELASFMKDFDGRANMVLDLKTQIQSMKKMSAAPAAPPVPKLPEGLLLLRGQKYYPQTVHQEDFEVTTVKVLSEAMRMNFIADDDLAVLVKKG